MTVFIWRILCIASAGVFAVVMILLLSLRLLKNRYYHNYEDNELIKSEQTSNSYNSTYFTTGETRKYIRKYVICKTMYDKFLVCNFVKKFASIDFYVIQYSRRKKAIAVLRITQTNTVGDSSKVITLSRRCAHVNVVVGSVDDKVINTDVIRPLSVSKIRLYSFLKSVALFCGLFVLRHVIVEIIADKTFIKQYLSDLMNYLAIAGSAVFAIAGYFISVACFRGKNVKAMNGGALEYDFL